MTRSVKKLLQTTKVIFTAAIPMAGANEITIPVRRSGRLTQINRKQQENSLALGPFNRIGTVGWVSLRPIYSLNLRPPSAAALAASWR